MKTSSTPWRQLPSVDALLQTKVFQEIQSSYAHRFVVVLIREYLDELRDEIRQGDHCPPQDEIMSGAAAYVTNRLRPSLRRVINATGVIIHTNLGRALLSEDALHAMSLAGREYSNLEYDLVEGNRGTRYVHAISLLRYLTGAEDALIVNNNAGALVLVLSALARGREALISRGQLVEIGGGFRIPEIMVQSGTKLVEVGTTNRTYLRDYQAALGEESVLILRVHASNFLITGFTHDPSLEELVSLGRERNVLVVHDLGSGALLDTTAYGLAGEPLVQDSVAAGVDLSCFSGDKLLGGPQAGIIVGRTDLIARLKKHPLTRALRVDKTTLAGLQATLLHYLRGEALEHIPVWRMISMPLPEIERRAQQYVDALADRGIEASIVQGFSAVGGGSLPGQTLPTRLLSLSTASSSRLAARLRAGDPPVIARIEDDRLVLDPRTILPEQDHELLAALIAAME